VNAVGPAALLIPSLDWDPGHGFTHLGAAISHALAIGVGGFLIRGGPRATVTMLAAELHSRSAIPLLLAADVERGAAQQFDGCIGLPPLGALASLRDSDVMRRAASVTARELKQLGLNWALAPVCDLDLAPGSAIVGTRAAGSDAATIAPLLADWIDACQHEGVLACAKHFPGHGQAVEDSHRTLPVVNARSGQLWHNDLHPFRAAVDAGVASIMTAHVAYPALDASGAPSTLSQPMLTALLRREMEFTGLIVSDSLEMDGVLAAGSESEVAVWAVAAGCDLLLGPADTSAVAHALERAAQDGVLASARLQDALDRRDRWALWAHPAAARQSTLDDMMWARRTADRCVRLLRGDLPRIGEAVEVIEVDDDAGGAWAAPSRAHFSATLHALEIQVQTVPAPSRETRGPVLVAAYADPVAWKGAAEFSESSRLRIHRALTEAHGQGRETVLVLFSHPRHAAQFPEAPNVLGAWGGDGPMQEAAARAIVRPRAQG
jgi:beta-glucosidase-like glycosyl hydrolase